MEPLICPQCGGQITDYQRGADFAVCSYCSTKFLIAGNRRSETYVDTASDPPPAVAFTPSPAMVFGAVTAVVGFVILIALVSLKSPSPRVSGTSPTRPTQVAIAPPSPTATPDTALLRFGGTGTENGQFADAASIAVDRGGRIYAADNKLRVQQFDDQGRFIKLLKVPANGRNYERARYIDKILVGADGRLYVGVGGVILIYTENWAAAPRLVQVAPDYISDFALRPDGSMLAVSYSDRIETLLFVNKQGGIIRRVEGFHTDALNASMSPLETAVASVRIATDSKGNIFSIYALGALGSYSLSFNDDDLAIVRSTPQVRFVKSMLPTRDALGLLVDSRERLYVAKRDVITVYDEDGNATGSQTTGDGITAFTVDSSGQVYTLTRDVIAKYPPIE